MPTPRGNSIGLTGVAVYDGLLQGSSWQFSGTHTLTYSFDTATLVNVEQVQFSDQTLNLTVPAEVLISDLGGITEEGGTSSSYNISLNIAPNENVTDIISPNSQFGVNADSINYNGLDVF
jgi:hypothetical protein